jgi:hypothetical protein
MPRHLEDGLRLLDPPIKQLDLRLTCANKEMRPVLPDSVWHYPELLSPQLRVIWRSSASAPRLALICAIPLLVLLYLLVCTFGRVRCFSNLIINYSRILGLVLVPWRRFLITPKVRPKYMRHVNS